MPSIYFKKILFLMKIKNNKIILTSLFLFFLIVIIGMWSNPSLNSIITQDTYDYMTLAENIFDEQANFRPPTYPLFLRISSVFGFKDWTKNVFLFQLLIHAIIIVICFLFFIYMNIKPWFAFIISLIAGLNPSQLYYLTNILPEMLLCSIITICWIMTLFYIYSKGSFYPIYILITIGFLSGVAALTKPVWLLGIFPIFISIFTYNKNPIINFKKLLFLTIGLHFLLIFCWKGFNHLNNVKLQNGKTLTVNICMASLRSGLIKYGEGTPIYNYLDESGYLNQAMLLEGKDNQKFREIYGLLSWEQRCDTEFANRIIKNAKFEFFISQMKYWHYFFTNRMFSPNKQDSFYGLPKIGRYLYIASYSYFYRPIMPLLLIITIIIFIINSKYRPLIFTSFSILIYFSLVIILFTKSQSSVMRMRVPVEIILFTSSLYPTIDLLKIYIQKKFTHIYKK